MRLWTATRFLRFGQYGWVSVTIIWFVIMLTFTLFWFWENVSIEGFFKISFTHGFDFFFHSSRKISSLSNLNSLKFLFFKNVCSIINFFRVYQKFTVFLMTIFFLNCIQILLKNASLKICYYNPTLNC